MSRIARMAGLVDQVEAFPNAKTCMVNEQLPFVGITAKRGPV